MYANLLLEWLSRRYTFPVDLNFLGCILRGIEVENVREEKNEHTDMQ